MDDEVTDDGRTAQRRIAELESELARHERARRLRRALDDRLEVALEERLPLERVMPGLLELLTESTGARAAAVQTTDESLSERTFVRGDMNLSPELLQTEARAMQTGSGVAAIHQLDVAGEAFGTAICVFDVQPSEEAHELLEVFCEQLDNHLAAIAQARRKYEVIRSISNALKEPVLGRGLTRAIEILRRQVDFEDLVLFFQHEDSLDAAAVRYRIHKNGELVHRSAVVDDPEVDAFLRANAAAFLDGDDAPVRERFGIQRYREEVLITGVRSARVVGRMLVTSRQGEFHTYDRELLDRFADYLRQRIVDFNREWKHLSNVFAADVCGQLLREEDYHEHWLTPRDAEVAILYADISGFTRLSESVLKTPEAIGRLIGVWADRAVDALWRHGGAFDKMIGDCVIGLFGPPFYREGPRDRCANALRAAIEIRDLTQRLVHDASLGLGAAAQPLDVAIGLNYCPASVGFFGPNDDYTAFSSGMNNTARLQGVAKAGEILCMQPFIDELGELERFSSPRFAEVKNVAEPLPFRALTD